VHAIATLGQAVVRSDERVLHEVEGGVVVETHAAHVAVDHVLVAAHQIRVGVALTGDDAAHEHGIVIRMCHTRAHPTTSTATCPPMPSSLRPGTSSGTNQVPSAVTNE
jgi:hypothetical protein